MSDYFSTPASGSGPTRATPPAWSPAPAAAPTAAWSPTPAAPWSPAPPTAPPGWPAYTGGSGLSGGPLIAVIIASVLGAFIVIGILAAVAIPVFLNQRAKAEAAATTVTMPEQMLGLTRLHDARSTQMEQTLRTQPGNPDAGVFGQSGVLRAAVSVTRHSMTSADDQAFLRGAEASFGASSFRDAQPGRLGGFVRCATVTSPHFGVCLFADHGAYGSVTLFGPFVGRDDIALSIREAIEHRS